MKIIRFGDAVLTAYEFSIIQSDDEIVTQRPAVLQPIGGAAGAFDFFAAEGYPLAPLTVVKRFTLEAPSDYDSLESALDDLREATIAVGRSKLWAQPRGIAVAASRWAYAKCTEVRAPEKIGNFLTIPIQVTFSVPEGLWYVDAIPINTGSASFQVTNQGNYPALVVATFQSGAYNPGLSISGVCSFSFAGAAGGSGLVINARTFSCTNNGVDAYSGLTIGSGQVAWFWIPPGTHTINRAGSGTVTVSWRDTYVY